MYIITASNSDLPYRGQACDKANIKPGATYPYKRDALLDLKKLQKYSKQWLKIILVEYKKEREAQNFYRIGIIDAYQLADMLKLQYTEVGSYIAINHLKPSNQP